jgi:HK97 family phage portal protein
MGLFRKKQIETREAEDVLLEALLGDDTITRKAAMSIPAVAACVNRIADTVASLDVKLYQRNGDDVTEIDDLRVERLNGDTGDTLTGYQMKRAMVVDMLLGKGGYAYIQKGEGVVKGLYYVPCNRVSFQENTDPIFKQYKVMVEGKSFEGYKFIKLLRNTENGYSGKSILAESSLLFEIVAASQEFEKGYSRRGGVKKGYLQTQGRIEKDKMQKIKEAYARMYSNSAENIVVLNEGLTFKEASATSQELQLNENKITNNADICKVFNVPPSIISGGATDEDKRLYYEGCIYPILVRFAKALDDVLLNPFIDGENEMFFAFDDTLLTKADIETRYKAYEIGLKNGFLQLDEVRNKENLPAFGLDFVKLGLQDVLLDPDNGDIYTPNMGVFANLKEKTVVKDGGQTDADTNQEELGNS